MTEKQGFLVVSDLHLSEGRNPRTGWIDPREDFLFDDDFADFLEFHASSREWAGVSWTLIIAGDFVDFLQVTDTPTDRPDLKKEGDYGLVTGPEESAWKMRRTMKGHPVFFRALAEFASRHRVIIVSGNHDAEFFYPQVRSELVDGLKSLGSSPDQPGISDDRINFCPWFWFDGDIYVEHGHQYDPVNAFPSALNPLLQAADKQPCEKPARIFFPLGSIFVRYLFNRVETSTPFADNIKPPTRFIGWFIRNHPLRALLFLLTDGERMLRMIRKSRRLPHSAGGRIPPSPEAVRCAREQGPGGRRPGDAGSWPGLVQQLERLQEAPYLAGTDKPASSFLLLLLGRWKMLALLSVLLSFNLAALGILFSPLWSLMIPLHASESQLLQDLLEWTRNTQAPLIFLLMQAVAWGVLYLLMSRHRKQHNCPKVQRDKAAGIAEILHPEYIIMGHCHQTDLSRLSGSQYVNTGTWTSIFNYDCEPFREENEFTYARIVSCSGKKSMDLMKWERRGGVGRRANLIDV